MDSTDAFSYHVDNDDQGPIITLVGDLDLSAAPALRSCLHDYVDRAVVLDFSGVTFMDSTALGVLLAAQKRMTLEGGQLILHGVQPAQMSVLKLTGAAGEMNFDGDGRIPPR